MDEEKKDRIDLKEFSSDRSCDFCNSQEGKIRKVGQYIVELSETEYKGETKLACQGCKRKFRSLDAHEKYNARKGLAFLKNLFTMGFKKTA